MKKLIATGFTTARGIHMIISYATDHPTTCPNHACGDLVDPMHATHWGGEVVNSFECGNCGATWEETFRYVDANASIVGGDSDGNIYTSSHEGQS
jgi:hypothetical protein